MSQKIVLFINTIVRSSNPTILCYESSSIFKESTKCFGNTVSVVIVNCYVCFPSLSFKRISGECPRIKKEILGPCPGSATALIASCITLHF
jgi:hypothetical protein